MAAARLRIYGAHGIEYPLFSGSGILQKALPEFLADLDNPQAIIISNDIVAPLYGEELVGMLPGSSLLEVPDGEQYKTLDTARRLYGEMLKLGADRTSIVIALGGGVIGDLAGFVAATFMRGVRFIQVPTTVLAMVDASIGGKVGVNLAQGKNLVGVFKDPIAIFQDFDVLSTLPEIEWLCGLAEMLKAGLVGDELLFEGLGDLSFPYIQESIPEAAQIKIEIIEADREERRQRAFLNLGHTFGHAFELLSNYKLKHGLAVATGIHAAANLSHRIGLLDQKHLTHIKTVLKTHDFPLTHRYKADDIINAMKSDKKREGNKQTFVLLFKPGEPVLVENVQEKDLRATLEELYADPR